MTLEQITDHAGQAVDRLLEQFKGSTQLQAFITALLGPVQTAEDDLWALYTERWSDTAIGAQLDILGEIVGQPREGRTDDVYRLYIRARILINRSAATPDDTLTLLQLIVPDTEFALTEQPPAGYLVEVFDLSDDATAIFNLIRNVKPAGVDIHLTYSDQPSSGLFALNVTPTNDSNYVLAGGIS